MLFNSLEFALFLPLAFIAFWLLFQKNTGHRNLFLIFISYIFYGWWDWRFLLLIIASSFVDFFISQRLSQEKEKRKRKLLVYSSLFFNLGILGVFKYYNFFIENFVEAFRIFGSEIQASSLNIILPVGISFYTFQTLSYTIDVYKGKLEATKDWKAFFAFVCFFPQLVAGPIERASNLLPQFYDKVKFSNKEATDGVRQILWGMFKKVVIADNCAIGVNHIFQNSADYSGGMLLLGGVLFAFQIYGDFSGYSDIAIGTARLFGFKLKQNFAFPYFSRNIAEFWRRWHISLSTWFRDYLYIPLGGSRGGNSKRIQNTFIIFLVSGFWHGANWTFIFWGFLNALYFLPLMLANKNRNYLDVAAANSYLPSVRELMQITFTFFITTLAWVFFRADSITHAFEYLGSLFTGLFSFSTYEVAFAYALENLGAYTLFCILFLLIVEWAQRRKQHGLDLSFSKEWRVGRWGLYFTVVVSILLFGSFESSDFIYFQF